jgi:hypothetical protein
LHPASETLIRQRHRRTSVTQRGAPEELIRKLCLAPPKCGTPFGEEAIGIICRRRRLTEETRQKSH